jgi:hypothetical protein
VNDLEGSSGVWSSKTVIPDKFRKGLALGITLVHFLICGILGVVVMMVSFGYSLSDAYNKPVWWFVVMDRLLLLLEAPVTLAVWLLYHPSARFEPPSLFTVDYVQSSTFLVVVGLCVLWSFGIGCCVAFAARWIKGRRAP